MLKAIQLENFKCYENSGLIPLAPLTLIFGPNSGGKSTILQALYLLMQTRQQGEASIPLLFQAENGFVDLGSYQEAIYAHKSKNRNISIRLDVPLDSPKWISSSYREWLKSIPATTMGMRFEFTCDEDTAEVSICGFEVYVNEGDQPLVRFENIEREAGDEKRVNTFLCKQISREPKYWQYLFENREKGEGSGKHFEEEPNTADEHEYADSPETAPHSVEDFDISEVLQELEGMRPEERLEKFRRLKARRLRDVEDIQDYIEAFSDTWSEILNQFSGSEYFLPGITCTARKQLERLSESQLEALNLAADYYDSHGERGRSDLFPTSYSTDLTERPALIPVSILYGAAYQIADVVERLRALGSIHPKPQRVYTFSGTNPTNVGRSGEKVPELLLRDSTLVEKVNNALEKLHLGYELKIEPLPKQYSSMFEIRVRNLSRTEAGSVSLSDVGFGVGQLLPVVVQSIVEKGTTILVEQPETHIHPAIQAELGAFFVENVKQNGNQFIIETHSEHLVLRIQRLIRKRTISPDQVKILCVDPNSGKAGPTVKEMRMDEKGRFIDNWPGGFFPERLSEFMD